MGSSWARPLLLGPLPGRGLVSRAPPLSTPRYWPVLDNALRAAAFSKGVRVRLLVSCGLNTDPTMFPYLRSLQALSNPAANVSVDVVRARSQPGVGKAPSSRPS